MVFTGLVAAALLAAQTPAAAGTARVAGQVVAAGTNAPIADARVILMPDRRGAPPAAPLLMAPLPQVSTDQSGRFSFDGLAPGTFRIDVQKPGFVPLWSPADPAPPAKYTLSAGQSLDNLTLTLKKGGAVSGRVLDSKGEPLANARVVALYHLARARSPVQWVPVGMGSNGSTNDLGDFRLFGLAPGEYIIGASPNRSGPFATASASKTTLATTYYPGTTDQNTALHVTVAADATVENITISMQTVPAFSVSGIVVDGDGKPVAGAMVMMMSAQQGGAFGGPAGETRTDESGAFTVNGVAPGTYRVMASLPIVSPPRQGAGGIVGGYTFVSDGAIGTARPPVEVAIADSDVAGIRVVVDRR